MPKLNLKGLHAVVTGASSGIGEATAKEFARAGAKLSLGPAAAPLLKRIGPQAAKTLKKGR